MIKILINLNLNLFLQARKKLFSPGLEPGTFRVLGERDNRYTTETLAYYKIYQYIN